MTPPETYIYYHDLLHDNSDTGKFTREEYDEIKRMWESSWYALTPEELKEAKALVIISNRNRHALQTLADLDI